MKLVKSLLLGSAAALSAVAGAQAADLPMRKAAPVEYVRVCTAYGAGFFYIPGTDTCIRVGGRARFEYNYVSGGRTITPSSGGVVGNLANGDVSSMRGLGRLNLDARTQTAYGTLRAFVRFEIAGASGGYLNSGTSQRFGSAFPALGIDTFGRAQQQVAVDKAFIQFAGFTAGRASSFFDFYAHDLEMITATSGSDVPSTNLLAYTFTFGNGFSATISAEDGTYRRQPVYNQQVFGGTTANTIVVGSNQAFQNLGAAYSSSTIVGPGVLANLDTVQRDRIPDVIGALRYDGPWGAAQVSAAMHEIFVGKYFNSQAFTQNAAGQLAPGAIIAGVAPFAAQQPGAEYGYAVQGGLKINVPQIAAGDVLWLQAAYSEGGLSFIGSPTRLSGGELQTNTLTKFSVNANDAFVDATGKMKLTEAWGVTGAFLHYWTPEWRSAAFGSYSEVSFGKGARSNTVAGPANLIAAAGSPAATAIAFSSTLRDYSVSTVGANLIWSPVRDLDIGVEAVYQRVDLKNGSTGDGNKGLGANALGVPLKTVKYDDVVLARFRVQRDF